MVFPLLIPIVAGIAGAAAGAGVTHVVHKNREDNLEDALTHTAAQVPQGQVPPEALAKLTAGQKASIKARGEALGLRIRLEEGLPLPSGQTVVPKAEAEAKLTPKARLPMGLMSPMERLGGW
jgi:hypothetical protein